MNHTPQTEDNLAEMAGADSVVNEKPANLPDKFFDPQSGEIRVDALINSYLELERKLSTMMPRPETDEDKLCVMHMLGMPETPEEYEVEVSHGLFDVDPEMNQRLHAGGFTLEQVQMVYDLAAEKLVPAILELSSEFQADSEVERLIAQFGGPERWKEMSRQLLAYGGKNLPPEVLENLAGSYEGVMALYRMMKGQEPGVGTLQNGNDASVGEGDLRSMMRDPRYWRERDPAFVEKVTDGFQRMYGE